MVARRRSGPEMGGRHIPTGCSALAVTQNGGSRAHGSVLPLHKVQS